MKVKIYIVGLSGKPFNFTLTVDRIDLTVEEAVELLIDTVRPYLGGEILDILKLDNPTYAAIINGIIIPREKWHNHLVADGSEMTIAPILIGGG